jgi:hypothetical protein
LLAASLGLHCLGRGDLDVLRAPDDMRRPNFLAGSLAGANHLGVRHIAESFLVGRQIVFRLHNCPARQQSETYHVRKGTRSIH